MEPLLERVAFTVGGVDYRWSDVVLAGALWGEWPAVVERARAGLAAIERESEAESARVEDAEIEAAADEFRYQRNLVSADDAESWLARWDLDAEQWINWVWSDLLRRRLLELEPEALAETSPEVDAEELELAIRAEAVCSGVLGRLSQRLAARAAVAEKLAEEGASSGDLAAGEGEEAVLPAIDAESLVPGFPAADLEERIGRIAGLDRAFERFRGQVATPEAIAARVRGMQADWMRLTCRILVAATEDVAREAMASIQEDGVEMSEVAAEAGAKIDEGTYYLEELDPGLRDRLLPAQKGELLGPLRVAHGHAVVQVLGKLLANPEDDEIRRRAEASVLESAVAREVDNRVAWRMES